MASDMFLENLEEYIFDENKVVTYKWLSSTLGVHVNQAKQMLFTFVDKHRNKKDNDDLSVVYFVSGTKHSKDGCVVHRCFVLPEEKLEAFKSTLSVLTSCHIYSVQKAKLKDSNALYMTDYEKKCENLTDYNKHSAIRCESVVLRSEEELRKLRGIKQTPQVTEKPVTNKVVNGHGAGDKAKSKAPAKTGIAGMFAAGGKAAANKKQTPTDVKPDITKDKEKSSESSAQTKGKPSGGMSSFFTKQSGVSSSIGKVDKEKPTEVKEKPAPIKEKSPPKKSVVKGKGKKTQREESDEEHQTKKRRRIRQAVFDSSSEEEDVDMEPESPVPSPPPREVTPPREATPPPTTLVADTPSPSNNNTKRSADASGDRRRKRKRKLVPKTFMDEDGYMVTEKVWESESTDASETEEPPKDPPASKKDTVASKKKPSPEKKVSPSKGSTKQASLMSFFKKK